MFQFTRFYKNTDFDESMGEQIRKAVLFVVSQIHLREIYILTFVCFGVSKKKTTKNSVVNKIHSSVKKSVFVFYP